MIRAVAILLACASLAAAHTVQTPMVCMQEDGADLACVPFLNCAANVTCSFDEPNNRVDIVATGGPGGGSSIVLDLADDGSNESTALAEIATTGDSNGIFTEPSADKVLVDVSKNWPTCDVAEALDCTDCLDTTQIDEGSLPFLTAEVDGSTTNEIQNLFETIDAPSGTDPVADGPTDTLRLLAGGIVTITGDSTTDSVTIAATEVDGSTTNELQNIFQTIDTSSGTDPVADTTADTVIFAGTAPITVTGDSAADSVTVACNVASGAQAGCLAAADFTTFSNKQAGPLSGDVVTSGAVATIQPDAVALGADTTGNYVASVSCTAPLACSGASEGSTPTFTVGDATTGAKGVVQLAGDLAGTATAPIVGPDAVALGVDTTGNYVASFTAGTGLTGNATGEGSTPTINAVAANASLLMGADDMRVQLQASADGLSSTQSSGSGLEVTSGGIGLLQGCADSQQQVWDETNDVWRCEFPVVRLDHAKYGTACAGTADATAAIATALTDASGGELYLPSNCRPLLASPGAGNFAVTIPTRTRIRCQDPSAGFQAQGLVCVGGSHAGAACPTAGASAYCPSGTCAGAQFAPTGGSAYGLINAAASSDQVELIGCTLWGNGIDGYYTCKNGTHDDEPCVQTCSGDSSLRCTATAQCSAVGAGTCTLDTLCSASGAGGTCDDVAGSPVGAGKVTLVDLSNATRARIERSTGWDHRRGDLGLAVGTDGVVGSIELGRTTYRYTVYQQDTLTAAVQLGTRGALADSIIYNPKGTGVLGTSGGYQKVLNNHITGDVSASTGVDLGGFSRVTNNRLETHLICSTDPADGSITNGGFTLCASGVRSCRFGTLVSGNWFGFSQAITLGSTSAANCNVSHLNITNNFAGSLFPGAQIYVPGNGTRCINANAVDGNTICSVAGDCACSVNGDCGSGGTCSGGVCTGSNACVARAMDTTSIVANVVYTGGIDMSDVSTASVTLDRNVISANTLHAGTGIEFPSAAAAMSGNSIAGNTCLDAVTACINAWPYGARGLGPNFGQKVGEPQHATSLYLTNKDGAAMVSGEAVAIYSASAVNSAVRRATTAREVIGIVTSTEGDASTVQVVVAGTTRCVTTDVATTRGDRLRLSATAGRGELASSSDDAYAVVLEPSVDQGAYQTALCRVGFTPGAAVHCVPFAGEVGCGVNGFLGIGGCSTTEANTQWPAPTNLTVVRMTCGQATDATCTLDCTLRKAGADQSAMAATSTNGVPGTDSTGTVAFAAGDALGVRIADTGGNCADNGATTAVVCYTQP